MRNWIIKKLGGYTAQEVDAVLCAFDVYTDNIENAERDLCAVVRYLEKEANNEVVH